MVVGTAVITVIVTIGTAVIVTAVGAILALTRIVTVIPMAVIAVTVTVIGAGAPLVVIRPIIAGARVTPEALPGVAARLVRQGTMTALTTPAGKFVFFIICLRGTSWASLFPGEYLWLDKVEVLQTRKVSVSKSNHGVPKFSFLSVHTTIVRKVSSDKLSAMLASFLVVLPSTFRRLFQAQGACRLKPYSLSSSIGAVMQCATS